MSMFARYCLAFILLTAANFIIGGLFALPISLATSAPLFDPSMDLLIPTLKLMRPNLLLVIAFFPVLIGFASLYATSTLVILSAFHRFVPAQRYPRAKASGALTVALITFITAGLWSLPIARTANVCLLFVLVIWAFNRFVPMQRYSQGELSAVLTGLLILVSIWNLPIIGSPSSWPMFVVPSAAAGLVVGVPVFDLTKRSSRQTPTG